MKKIVATFVIALTIASMFACSSSKPRTSKENTSTIMDSGAQSTPPIVPDSTRQ